MVGRIGISPSDFNDLDFADAFLIIDGFEMKLEEDFNLNILANVNAIGLTNDKNFKLQNPFKEKENDISTASGRAGSIKERLDTFSQLENVFRTTIE